MNKFEKIVNKNLRRYIHTDIVNVYMKPNSRNKLYERTNGKLISHRALVKVIRKLIEEKI